VVNRERQRRFESLLREHQRIVFKIASAYARGVDERDDLAQEIVARL
jgi:RNA polymerase sigma-70 factor (ECF subfamily)